MNESKNKNPIFVIEETDDPVNIGSYNKYVSINYPTPDTVFGVGAGTVNNQW